MTTLPLSRLLDACTLDFRFRGNDEIKRERLLDLPLAFKGMLSYRRSLTGSFESVWSELKGEVQDIIDADAPLMLQMFRAQSDKSLRAITAVLANISLKKDGEFVRFPAIQEYLPHRIPASIIAVDEAGFPTEIKYHQFNIGAEDRSITDPDFEELYELLVGIREDEAYKTCFHLVGQTLSQQVIIPPELQKIYDTSIDRINVHPTYAEGNKESPMLRLNALLNLIHIYTEYHAHRIDAFGCIISDTVSAETVANAIRINDIMIERELETDEYLSFIDFYEFFQINEL